MDSHEATVRRDPEMNAIVRRAVFAAVLAGLVVAPSVVLVGQSVWGTVRIAEVVVGSALATAFLAVTGIVTLIFRERPSLKNAVMTSYVAKTSLILLALYALPANDADRLSMAIAMIVSAVAYLSVQTILVVRGEAALRANRPKPHYVQWDDDDAEDDSDRFI